VNFLCNLCLLLTALKLLGVIDLSWFFVTMPVWMPWFLALAFGFCYGLWYGATEKKEEDKHGWPGRPCAGAERADGRSPPEEPPATVCAAVRHGLLP